MAFKMRARKGIRIGRVVSKIVATVLALWVGGTIMDVMGDVMNGTSSPFYEGLELIGWTVTNNQIVDTSQTGVLAVVGIVGIASIVTEFVEFRM